MSTITGGRTWLAGLLIAPSLIGFLLLDAGVGLMLGVATAAAVVVIAVRSTHDVAIEVADPGPGIPGGVFVLAAAPIETPPVAQRVARIAEATHCGSAMVVAPAPSSVIDRFSGDLEESRFESQRVLTLSLASLAAAGVRAEGRVGDSDPLQAAEDELRTYAASEVVVVARERAFVDKLAELERRLRLPVRRVTVPASPAEHT
jgi:hypothetical protein